MTGGAGIRRVGLNWMFDDGQEDGVTIIIGPGPEGPRLAVGRGIPGTDDVDCLSAELDRGQLTSLRDTVDGLILLLPTQEDTFPLTFGEALCAMLDGRVCASEVYPESRTRFHEGVFQQRVRGSEWGRCTVFGAEQTSMWRVVE